jgi:DNA-binding NtrC family response regulator
VLRGEFARARRLSPSRDHPASTWWEVEFLPLGLPADQEAEQGFLILGRVRALPAGEPGQAPPLPERLMDLRQRRAATFTLDLLESAHPSMHRLARQVRLAAGVRAPVLLVGERGTGKETIARIIHYQGPDKERPFAALDCRRLPATLLIGALFGHPGASRPPLGAVYLDGLADLPRDVQLLLSDRLSAQEGAAQPRILAGCRGRPEDDVRSGKLLEGLYCLISPLTLEAPPLRERLDDLPGLVERILATLDREADRPVAGLTPAAWEVLRHHCWPGNLAELRRVLADARQRAATDRIDAGDLPAAMRLEQRLEQEPLRPAPRPVPLQETLAEVERRLIRVALGRTRGNRSRAAELLGIYRARLHRRMEALGMEEAEGGEAEE